MCVCFGQKMKKNRKKAAVKRPDFYMDTLDDEYVFPAGSQPGPRPRTQREQPPAVHRGDRVHAGDKKVKAVRARLYVTRAATTSVRVHNAHGDPSGLVPTLCVQRLTDTVLILCEVKRESVPGVVTRQRARKKNDRLYIHVITTQPYSHAHAHVHCDRPHISARLVGLADDPRNLRLELPHARLAP